MNIVRFINMVELLKQDGFSEVTTSIYQVGKEQAQEVIQFLRPSNEDEEEEVVRMEVR